MTTCDNAKRRETRQRQIVLDTVREHSDHPTADSLYLDVRSKDEKISRGTVYRNLKNLSDEGEIYHIKVPGADRYDLRTDSHYHFLCIGCGAVTDVPEEYDKGADIRVADGTGNLVLGHTTVFEGYCPECRKRRESGTLSEK